VFIQVAPPSKSANISAGPALKRGSQVVSLTGADGSDDEDEDGAAEVISPDKRPKTAETGRASRRGQPRYSAKDKRVLSDMQSAMSSEQHAAATAMAENDMCVAKLKVEAQQKAVEKLNERNLAVLREANKAVLATSIRETAAEMRKEDPKRMRSSLLVCCSPFRWQRRL
jgi:hypothetical protein